MIYGNYHMHTTWCDGKADIAAYVEKARVLNLKYLGFSAHAPVPIENDWTLSNANLPLYLGDLKSWQDKSTDPVILRGLELDFFEQAKELGQLDFSCMDLDFTIGSVHYIKGRDQRYLTIDGPVEEFMDILQNGFDGDIRALVCEYYRLYELMARTSKYTFLGHFDVIKKRNRDNRFFSEKESWYLEAAEKTLETIAKQKQIMEINTGGLARGATDEVYPAENFIKRAVAGSIDFCINSDAHHPDQLVFWIDEAQKLLKSCGADSCLYLTPDGWKRQSL